MINYSGTTLKVSAIRKEDRGTYYCVAENGVGRGARRNINVEVEFAPVITVPRPRLGQALQYDMDLECHVEAYPPPALTWHKDEVQLSNNQHHSISHFATADEYTDSTLRIITIEKRQYGEYICKAANKLGSSEQKVELFGKKIFCEEVFAFLYVYYINIIYRLWIVINCRLEKPICPHKGNKTCSFYLNKTVNGKHKEVFF